ncbi:MAG: type IV toxin-antitoxin system AbiEi family antitoxin [Lascolabacillus sp.]|jgi:predicted transcriptional regulator of viral defense system|nr:type IV toxin-antitoxin system AbiEi family antitoxin [Lascolabacillus sp.]
MSLNDWIKEQEQRGITTFSFQQIRSVFHERSEKTLKTDINRLTLSKRIQNVYKGFYVIIPTQYQLKGVVPPIYYINELMEYLGKPYYVGLLSAAAIYGASHQRAMITQIVTIGPRPRTSNKNKLLDWNYRQQIPIELIESRNAEMGRINYSSAELTAVDIIQFASNIGGYQRATTVLAELVDVIDMSKIGSVLPYTTTTAMQRLGYLLEFILFEQDKSDILYNILKKRNRYFNAVLMSSEHPALDDAESNRWRVNMNIDIEVDEL